MCQFDAFPLCFYFGSRTIKIPDSADGLGFQIRGFGPSVVHAVGRGKRSPPPPLEMSGLISKRLPITLLMWQSWKAAATSFFGGVRDLATGGLFSALMLSIWSSWLDDSAAKTAN